MKGKASVVGAGTMGHGIAQILATSGYEVYLYDLTDEILKNALDRIRQSLEKFQSKGIVKDVEEIMLRIKPTTSLEEALRGSAIVIEAAPEEINLKKEIFRKAEALSPEAELLATNTSSLPITEISEGLSKREKVIGLHFFNPPQLMRLVEVVKGNYTSDKAVNRAVELAKELNKTPVLVMKDVPGFIVNRLLARLMNASCQLVERGRAEILQIDSAVKHKLGFPMGVFELADYSGVDVFYLVFKAMKERGFVATLCRSFEEKYLEKKFGVKSGEGFYKYPGKGIYKKPEIPKEAGEPFDPWLVVAPEIAEAYWIINNNVASEEDVNVSSKLGLGYPKGIMEYEKEIGKEGVRRYLQQLKEITGLDEYDYLLKFL